ncbi:uncharacterized protein LOC128395989 [Panonychus citri]|uniref:uncharacterized protein LOC128395989 n=1 Tax=Panonychus citri TaxID=50023 RepID=UPI002307F1BD|nr:uncharacterized protein LOC128395989 [Panonychus citri]
MKFSLVLISLFCISAINAGVPRGPSTFDRLLLKLVDAVVKDWEKTIPNWDGSASLEKNILTVLDTPLETATVPDWNPLATSKDNLVYILESKIRKLNLPGCDATKSIVDNLNCTVTAFLDSLPFPYWIPKKIRMNLLQDLYDVLKKIQSPGFDVNNSVDENIVALVDDLLNNLNGLDPKASLEEVVNAFVKKNINQIKFPGFNPSNTLDQNIADILVAFLPF